MTATQTQRSSPVTGKLHRLLTHGTPTRRSVLWRIGQMTSHVVTSSLFHFKAYGIEHVPASGGVLLASTHQSYLDPVLIGVRLRRPVSYMASAYLFRNPFFGWLIRSLHAFPVEQGKGDRAAVNACIERLKEGHMLCIYPEGHRSPDGEIKELQGGISLIARRAGVPVIPVVIDGAFEAWPRKKKLPWPHPVHLLYGEPIDVTGMDGATILKTLDERFRAMLRDLRSRRSRSGWPADRILRAE